MTVNVKEARIFRVFCFEPVPDWGQMGERSPRPLLFDKRLCRHWVDGHLLAEQVAGFVAFSVRFFYVSMKGYHEEVVFFYDLGALRSGTSAPPGDP